MKHKTFKTFDEQIEKLKNRGLIIKDDASAKVTLTEISYYRLSGYTLALRSNDIFCDGITFDDVMQIYNFDRELRLFILDWLEDIEISLRVHIGHTLGAQDTDPNGQMSYFKPENYVNETEHMNTMEELNSMISDASNEAFVKHHRTKYDGILPPWVLTETMSFGKLSKFMSRLSINIQKNICQQYYHGKRFTIITNWMEGLVVLRNMCAHKTRLINRGIIMKPDFSKQEVAFFESEGYQRNEIGTKVFFRLIIIDRLSSNPDSHTIIKNAIRTLSDKYPFVDLKYYGFKPSWESIFDKINADYL